jgi:hypothetical protein
MQVEDFLQCAPYLISVKDKVEASVLSCQELLSPTDGFASLVCCFVIPGETLVHFVSQQGGKFFTELVRRVYLNFFWLHFGQLTRSGCSRVVSTLVLRQVPK